jgi:hypothetical protein
MTESNHRKVVPVCFRKADVTIPEGVVATVSPLEKTRKTMLDQTKPGDGRQIGEESRNGEISGRTTQQAVSQDVLFPE